VGVRLIAAGLLLALAAPVQASVPLPLADGVHVLRDSFSVDRQPDGNSVIFGGPRGQLVVDTGRHIEHSQALLDFARARSQPIVAVVNTHWHLDHIGGNALLRQQVPGLTVLASNAVAPAMAGWLANSRREMQAMLDSPRTDTAARAMIRIDIALIDHGQRLLPDQALDAGSTVDVIGRPLQIGFERYAVTAADLWVYDPASRVLAAGDLVTLPVPFLDTACTPGWRAALAHLEAQPFELLVPGHGAPMSRADFNAWRRGFDGLLACAAGPAEEEQCITGWVQALGGLLPAAQVPRVRDMLMHYLGQHLRSTPERRDRFCSTS
jgi:glyoxylase-like metal-dependent hydrolase (beta-lactamase superfamily II)